MKKHKLFYWLFFFNLSCISASCIAASEINAFNKPSQPSTSPISDKFTQQLTPSKDDSIENFFTSVSVSQGIKYFVSADNIGQPSHYSVQGQSYGWQDPSPDFLNPAFVGWLTPDPDDNQLVSTPFVASSALGMAAQYFIQNQTELDSVFLVPLMDEDNYGLQLMTRF